ncbi:hypothetical protein TNCV_351671 [Trichonephila clavipes]|nr:hypothetical protein TNCV_351671 [Trichonephila clavipes]
MLDWRQIWGSGRPRKGSNSTETVLCHPCRVGPNIVLLKNGSWKPLHEWQHMFLQDAMVIPMAVMWCLGSILGVTMYCSLWQPIPSHLLWER